MKTSTSPKTRSFSNPTWRFPLERPHLGALLGNGDVGAMVWGEGNILRITLGRPDVWDHQWGGQFKPEQTYQNIRQTLESKDKERLTELFRTDTPYAHRATIMPLGRFEFNLGKRACLQSAELHLESGILTISGSLGRQVFSIQLVTDIESGAIHLAWDEKLKPIAQSVPAWDLLRSDFEQRGFTPPTHFKGADFGGWTQEQPQDPAVSLGWTTCGHESALVVIRPQASDDEGYLAETARALADALTRGYRRTEKRAKAWWKSYWQDVPTLSIPNASLQLLHDYGMYKFGIATRPGATPCTLQGPWIEDYHLPPWSDDYHFNINVQMCYWPAYHGNRLENLKPLFKMVLSWLPQLQANAKIFTGIENGIMLPHAVSDQCQIIGNFWTGMMDHACSMWISEMMFRYVRYSGDKAFLKADAYPFMCGTIAVLEQMLETLPDGSLAIPVGVSPEFWGASINAWGRNPSFQLAATHRLAEDILSAAEMLKVTPPAICQKILDHLPKAALEDDGDAPCIALWEGLKLPESHRHHSHLGAIVPFDTIDCEAPEWAPIVEASIRNWIYWGPSCWSGWCVPWASMLHTRVGNATMAEMWLDIWQRFFMNRGFGTLHDPDACGISLLGVPGVQANLKKRNEIMQLDGGMGCVAALYEMLLHDRRGVHYLFRGAPARWDDVAFQGILALGGVRVSAARHWGKTSQVTLEASFPTTFQLANPFDGTHFFLQSEGKKVKKAVPENGILTFKLKKQARIQLFPAP